MTYLYRSTGSGNSKKKPSFIWQINGINGDLSYVAEGHIEKTKFMREANRLRVSYGHSDTPITLGDVQHIRIEDYYDEDETMQMVRRARGKRGRPVTVAWWSE